MKNLPSIILMLLIIFLASCEQENIINEETNLVCGVKDPIKDLEWLNTEFNSLIRGPAVNGIVLYNYNGNNVIEIQGSNFSSTNQHQYNCDGSKLNLNDSSSFNNYKQLRKEIKILYGTKIWNN